MSMLKGKISSVFVWLFGALALSLMAFGLFSFIEKGAADRVSKVVVKLDFGNGMFFMQESDVIHLLSPNGTKPVVGTPFESLDLFALEAKVKAGSYVQDAELYKDLNGVLVAEVKVVQPIVRLVAPTGKQAYLDAQGTMIPVSRNFTPRVLVVDGPFVKNFLNDSAWSKQENAPYLSFFRYITEDDHRSKLFSQMSISSNGEITLQPVFGDYLIEFGMPDNLDNKFKKLDVFYKEILKHKGWDKYHSVKLQYQKQIICE
jgi:cell division protein FtsQ